MKRGGNASKEADSIHRARSLIAAADALIITAGAGMGVDSGLPDFRGTRGFWKAYPVAERLGLSFAEMANPVHFQRNPQLAWAFYGHRLALYRRTVPHRGFTRLLDLATSRPGSYFVFTSNVDGHFHQAGFDTGRIVECHGSIHRLQCSARCNADTWTADDLDISVDEQRFVATGELPRCGRCGAIARPNILMFDDSDWLPDITDQQYRRLDAWWHQLCAAEGSVVIIEIGAGSAVPTVRLMSERLARYQHATLVRINPREAEVPSGNISITATALTALDQLLPD